MTSEPAGLHCPGCGQPADITIGGTQAFCANDACTVIMWNPAKSITEMLSEGIQVISDKDSDDS